MYESTLRHGMRQTCEPELRFSRDETTMTTNDCLAYKHEYILYVSCDSTKILSQVFRHL